MAEVERAPGLRARAPDGAFYLFIDCGGLLGKRTPAGAEIETSSDFVRYLLESFSVAVVPGIAFEFDPYFRLSFAAADQVLAEGLRRITEACSALE